MKLNPQQERVKLVLSRMIDMIMDDDGDAEIIAEELDLMLDGLKSKDFFGSEAQTDPRGDGRNGEWSIDHVEGIDE